MIFYHGTTKEKWAEIQEEGVLWGVRNAPSRCTYLTPMIEEARCYGEIVLRVDYDPLEGDNNYVGGCWQHREYFPIALDQVILVGELQ